ncbi:MAG TPA: phage holin family protein [Candidatus Fimihabitans intestinipullorum]|uniref:Phage holin family protein n=1 Tax=Candidatus Fimihabitans intestinipullorum TaxID=2840820 RepID=A0A9D1HVS1_9BACT|nr:phage holin family protein [Candidatus Fimihabitans intestinipullorum]
MSQKTYQRISKVLDWLVYMLGYTIVLIAVSVLFKKTVYIDNSLFGLWGFIAVIIIYILNKTIKPLIVWLTLPLTGLTLGLFYPFINVFILKIVEFILNGHFAIHGIWMAFIVAIFISVMNGLMDTLIIEPLIRRMKA